jgi:GT2 family glycosyltransferase
VLNADGTLQRTCHNFPSPLVFFLEQTSLWRLAARLPYWRDRLQLAGDHDRARDADWLLGACLLVRGEAFQQAGGFDESFFFYWEESDLCKRLRNAGWRVVFEPAGEAVHLGGASSKDPVYLVQFFLSLYRFYSKHYSRQQLIITRAIVRLMGLLKAGRSCGKALLAGEQSEAGKAYASARTWLKVASL